MTHANLQWDNLETGVPRTRGYARDKKNAKLYILETNMYCIQFGFFQINKDESWICLFVFQIEATGGQPRSGRSWEEDDKITMETIEDTKARYVQ